MKRFMMFASTLAFMATANAVVAAPVMVKEVEVTADLTAVKNPQAAQYFANVADDVKNAIVTRLTDRIMDDGVSVKVELSGVELSNSLQEAFNAADTKMSGTINVKPQEPGDPGFNSYKLTVDVNQAMTFMPAGTDVATLTQDSPEYYNSLVNAFADAVVVRLE